MAALLQPISDHSWAMSNARKLYAEELNSFESLNHFIKKIELYHKLFKINCGYFRHDVRCHEDLTARI